MNEKFEKFYTELGESRNKTALQTLMDDGAIITNLEQFNDNGKTSVDIMNCYLNPFYFLDKLKINGDYLDMNIGNYLSLRYFHIDNKNIVLELPPHTNKTTTIIAYAIYVALFHNKDVYYYGDNDADGLGYDLASSLPDSIKNSMDIINALSHIHINDINNAAIDREPIFIYDCMNIDEMDIDVSNPCIIINELGDGPKYTEKLVELSKKSKRKFVQCRYSIKDLGYSMDDIIKIYKENYNEDTLKDFLLNYAFV